MAIATAVTTIIKNMTAADVKDNTRQIQRVMSEKEVKEAVAASDLWSAFDADNAAWRLANPDQPDPQFAFPCAVADIDNITLPERMFVEVRFVAERDDGGSDERVVVGWAQVKGQVAVSAGFFNDLLLIHNYMRSFTNHEPA
jgi:hypothetical protein